MARRFIPKTKKNKYLKEEDIDIAWTLHNEMQLALEERDILLEAEEELISEKNNISTRLKSLRQLLRYSSNGNSDGQ